MRRRHAYDEEDVTGCLFGSLVTVFDKTEIGGVKLSATILRHGKGTAAEERRYGADMLMHVSMDTPTPSYSKGVLIRQRKKSRVTIGHPHLTLTESMSATGCLQSQRLRSSSVRPGKASAVGPQQEWRERGSLLIPITCATRLRIASSFSYFGVLSGDPRITSANVEDLLYLFVLKIDFSGQLTFEPGLRPSRNDDGCVLSLDSSANEFCRSCLSSTKALIVIEGPWCILCALCLYIGDSCVSGFQAAGQNCAFCQLAVIRCLYLRKGASLDLTPPPPAPPFPPLLSPLIFPPPLPLPPLSFLYRRCSVMRGRVCPVRFIH